MDNASLFSHMEKSSAAMLNILYCTSFTVPMVKSVNSAAKIFQFGHSEMI